MRASDGFDSRGISLVSTQVVPMAMECCWTSLGAVDLDRLKCPISSSTGDVVDGNTACECCAAIGVHAFSFLLCVCLVFVWVLSRLFGLLLIYPTHVMSIQPINR